MTRAPANSSRQSVSVIIPAYNAAATIAETIASIREDAVQDLEIIVIDDGSTDRTLAAVAPFHDRITLLQGPNRGASAARNAGIAIARGEWLLFLDADDLLAPGTIARRLASADAADVVICDWDEFDHESPERRTLQNVDFSKIAQDAESAFASTEWATTAAILYRASSVRRAGGFKQDLSVIQDARLAFDVAHTGAIFVHSPHVGASYRIVAGSLSRRNPENFYGDILRSILQVEALWNEAGTMSNKRLSIVRDGVNTAARGLFRGGSPLYLEAIRHQARLGRVPLHSRIAAPLAHIVGMKGAQQIMALLNRA